MDWIAIAKDFGVPVAVMAALLTFLWITAHSIWVGLVIPFRDVMISRIAKFFDRLDDTLATLVANVASVNDNMTAQTKLLERIDQKGCAQRDREIFNDVVDKAIKDAENKAKNHK